MQIIGFAGGQYRHFLIHPLAATFLLKLFLEVEIDVAQIGDVGQCIVELLVRKRASAPVGKAGRFVEMLAGDFLHELIVGNRIAETADHRRNLTVEDR
jgi:hypothetical protein